MSQDFFVEVICDIKDRLEIVESMEDYSKRCEFIEDIQYLMKVLKIAPSNEYPEIEEVEKQVNNLKNSNNFILNNDNIPSCSNSTYDDSDYVAENFNDIQNEYKAVKIAKEDGNYNEYISGIKTVTTKILNLYHATPNDHYLNSIIFDSYLEVKRELDEVNIASENEEKGKKERNKNLINIIDKECRNSSLSSDSTSWSEVVSKKKTNF